MTFQPYPTAPAQQPDQPRPPAPKPVVLAERLMYAGAAVSILGTVISASTEQSLRADFVQALHRSKTHETAAQMNSIVHAFTAAYLVVTIGTGLAGAALWAWMAWKNRAGRQWARVLATVFGGLYTILAVLVFFSLLNLLLNRNASTSASGWVLTVLPLLHWVIGLGAIILIWQKESGAYYQASSAASTP